MNSRQAKALSVADLKFKLGRMGMSLDKSDHPKDYYVKLYLDKSNAKNKVTRNNTPFYNEQINPREFERLRKKNDKKEIEYEEEDDKEGIEIDEDDKNNSTKKKEEFIYKTNKKDYKIENDNDIKEDSGIKVTRLVRMKQKKNQKNEEFNTNSKKSDSKKKKNNFFNEQAGNVISDYSLRKRNRNENLELPIRKRPKNKNNNMTSTPEIINANDDNKNINEEIEIKEPMTEIKEEQYFCENQNTESKLQNSENKISEKNEMSSCSDVTSYTSSKYSFFSRFSSFSVFSFGNIKNNIMNKCKKYIYLWPLLLLILFGITFFLNEKYEAIDRCNIVIIFSIIMGLVLLYHLCKYIKEIRKFKKMAKEDRQKLLDLLNAQNINRDNLANNSILLNNFILTRIPEHNLTTEEYMKCVFPYLSKYLKKDGFALDKQNKNEGDNKDYWKEI